jgi:predicted DNA-binding protein (MmcQ/YjbR family)
MPRTAPDPRSLEGKLRAWALGFPGATEEFPWGERAFKVAGKVFLFLGRRGEAASFSMKLPRSAAEALELGFVEPTGYGLGKHGWVTATVDTGREAPLELFQAWLDESFRAEAPKKVIAQLDGGGPPPAKAKRATKPKSKSKSKRR